MENKDKKALRATQYIIPTTQLKPIKHQIFPLSLQKKPLEFAFLGTGGARELFGASLGVTPGGTLSRKRIQKNKNVVMTTERQALRRGEASGAHTVEGGT